MAQLIKKKKPMTQTGGSKLGLRQIQAVINTKKNNKKG